MLLSVAALGPARGALGMLLHAVAGVAGLPWFAGQQSGWVSRRSATPAVKILLASLLLPAAWRLVHRRGVSLVARRARSCQSGHQVVDVRGRVVSS